MKVRLCQTRIFENFGLSMPMCNQYQRFNLQLVDRNVQGLHAISNHFKIPSGLGNNLNSLSVTYGN